MKHIVSTFFIALFCAGLNAQTFEPSTLGVQPEFGFVLDSAFTTHKNNGSDANLQMAELSISSRIDPLARGFAIIEFPGAHELEVSEAVLIFDGLGDGWEIRAGRMNIDLGKFNTVHSHDMAMPFGDPVRLGLFGGHLRGQGLELHKWFALGDAPMRFSAGAWSKAGAHSHGSDGHALDLAGEEHDHAEVHSGSSGKKGFDDWAFSGRLSSQNDFGDNGWWQWGVSYFGSSGGMYSDWSNELDESDGQYASGRAFGLGVSTFGADASFKIASLADDSWKQFSFEYWHHTQDHAHAEGAAQTFELESSKPQGAWLVAEHGFSNEWSAAAHVRWWETENNESLKSAYRYGVAVSRHFSEFNRVRFAIEQIDEPAADTDWLATIQWSVFMGKHRHGLDW
jgi:hypothetical protein